MTQSTAVPIPSRDRPTWLRFVLRGILSLFVGLKVTLRTLFGKKVTDLYPYQKSEMSEAYRGTITLVRFDDMGTHDCIACDACEIICPSLCIVVKGDRIGGTKKKRADIFTMDFSTCSLCGLCIAVCPTDTLQYSKAYDDAGYDRNEWKVDLLAEFTDDPPEDEMAQILIARDEVKKAAKKAARAAAKAAKAEKTDV
jgi:NADH-quinone oxidoreductase subunit I